MDHSSSSVNKTKKKCSIVTSGNTKAFSKSSHFSRREPLSNGVFSGAINGSSSSSSSSSSGSKMLFQPQRHKSSRSVSSNFANATNDLLIESIDDSAIFQHRTKKKNLNHLISAYYKDRPNERLQKQPFKATFHRNKFNRSQFLLSNCQFLIRPGFKSDETLSNPDLMIDWNEIEEIRILSGGNAVCPICLYAPKAAKITRCGHTYCWSCMLHYLSLKDDKTVACPICFQTVKQGDLKSVVWSECTFYAIGESISFRLMEVKPDSLGVQPSFDQEATTSDDYNDRVFSKFLKSTAEQLLEIVEREKKELIDQYAQDPDCPENCFVNIAQECLRNREQTILVNIASGVFDSECEQKQTSYHKFEETPPPLKICYFYQVIDGQHIYLNVCNMKMLEHSFGEAKNLPKTIRGKVLDKKPFLLDDNLRSKMKFLKHLPLNCCVEFVEIAFEPDIISDETYNYFADSIEKQRAERQKKADMEKKHFERVEKDEREQMKLSRCLFNIGEKFSESLHLESTTEFPVVQSDILSSSSQFQLANSSFCGRKSYANSLSFHKNTLSDFPLLNTKSEISGTSKSINRSVSETSNGDEGSTTHQNGNKKVKSKKTKYTPIYSTNW